MSGSAFPNVFGGATSSSGEGGGGEGPMQQQPSTNLFTIPTETGSQHQQQHDPFLPNPNPGLFSSSTAQETSNILLLLDAPDQQQETGGIASGFVYPAPPLPPGQLHDDQVDQHYQAEQQQEAEAQYQQGYNLRWNPGSNQALAQPPQQPDGKPGRYTATKCKSCRNRHRLCTPVRPCLHCQEEGVECEDETATAKRKFKQGADREGDSTDEDETALGPPAGHHRAKKQKKFEVLSGPCDYCIAQNRACTADHERRVECSQCTTARARENPDHACVVRGAEYWRFRNEHTRSRFVDIPGVSKFKCVACARYNGLRVCDVDPDLRIGCMSCRVRGEVCVYESPLQFVDHSQGQGGGDQQQQPQAAPLKRVTMWRRPTKQTFGGAYPIWWRRRCKRCTMKKTFCSWTDDLRLTGAKCDACVTAGVPCTDFEDDYRAVEDEWSVPLPGRGQISVREEACVTCQCTAEKKCKVFVGFEGFACVRCTAWGLPCVPRDKAPNQWAMIEEDISETVAAVQLRYVDKQLVGFGTGNRDDLEFPTCGACTEHGRYCDRQRPCDSCIHHADRCDVTGPQSEPHLVPGTFLRSALQDSGIVPVDRLPPPYYMALGYGPDGVDSDRSEIPDDMLVGPPVPLWGIHVPKGELANFVRGAKKKRNWDKMYTQRRIKPRMYDWRQSMAGNAAQQGDDGGSRSGQQDASLIPVDPNLVPQLDFGLPPLPYVFGSQGEQENNAQMAPANADSADSANSGIAVGGIAAQGQEFVDWVESMNHVDVDVDVDVDVNMEDAAAGEFLDQEWFNPFEQPLQALLDQDANDENDKAIAEELKTLMLDRACFVALHTANHPLPFDRETSNMFQMPPPEVILLKLDEKESEDATRRHPFVSRDDAATSEQRARHLLTQWKKPGVNVLRDIPDVADIESHRWAGCEDAKTQGQGQPGNSGSSSGGGTPPQPCGQVCHESHVCANRQHIANQGEFLKVCDGCDRESKQNVLEGPGRLEKGEVLDMRSYACSDCAPDELSKGGVELDPRPLTGCRCGEKLFGRRLCSAHRYLLTDRLVMQTALVKEWQLTNFAADQCMFCKKRRGAAVGVGDGQAPVQQQAQQALQQMDQTPAKKNPSSIFFCLNCQTRVADTGENAPTLFPGYEAWHDKWFPDAGLGLGDGALIRNQTVAVH
ncbi:hypothetical protein ACRALDRAFT_1070070 [Sodiomyces alcalophilus JCM 7366]|uniref:uncharacterized protein n=1 Tax=Sodiomyces alcalophilus JCM 7366 TaxID=591952 RepID=UPI0039B42E0F